jgi:hypothetical protein
MLGHGRRASGSSEPLGILTHTGCHAMAYARDTGLGSDAAHDYEAGKLSSECYTLQTQAHGLY